jgi:cytochrome c
MRIRNSPVVLMAVLSLGLIGCERYSNEGSYREASRITGGGNPATGKETIRRYGCQGCHSIPGIRDANGVVGPPLDHLSHRIYLAGELPNTTENLMHWIQRPHDIHPRTAMPEMGVTDEDARDIAAYLYTLK